MAMSYDYTVFAGTQGAMESQEDRPHVETRRTVAIAVGVSLPKRWRPPPAISTRLAVRRARLHNLHAQMARLSGQVPFWWCGVLPDAALAGTRRLLGCCDVIIATENAQPFGWPPAMIEGGGLGSYTPRTGSARWSMPWAQCVIDVLVQRMRPKATRRRQANTWRISQGDLAQWRLRGPQRAWRPS